MSKFTREGDTVIRGGGVGAVGEERPGGLDFAVAGVDIAPLCTPTTVEKGL